MKNYNTKKRPTSRTQNERTMSAVVIKKLSTPGANMCPAWCLLSDLPARVLVWLSYPLALCWCWW